MNTQARTRHNDEDIATQARRQSLLCELNDLLLIDSGLDVTQFGKKAMDILDGCSAEDLALLPTVCDQRTGRNLAGVLIEIAYQGWGGRYNSLFRQLAQRGFDVNVVQKNGNTPALDAIRVDQDNLHEDDLKWAFKHGLNPLAHYPDMAEGQSLLSVDFGPRSDEFTDFIGSTIRRRMKKLDREAQHATLDMLRKTAQPVYAPLIAEMTRKQLNAGLEKRTGERQKKPRM